MVKNILVVDNNPVHLKIVAGHLEQLGHNVVTAKDGLAALKKIESFTPEIAFIDLIMPYIGGDVLSRVLRSRPELKNLSIIVISGVAAEAEINCSRMGVDACIAKGPYVNLGKNIDHVLAQIENGSIQQSDQGIIGIEDIYKREATLELLHHKKHYEIILQNISDVLLELSSDGKIINVNDAAVDLLSTTKEQLFGKNFIDLFAEYDREEIAEIFSTAKDSGPQEIGADVPLLLNEHLITLQLLPVESNSHMTILAIAQDITESYQAQQALRESHSELKQIFNTAADGMVVIDLDHRIMRANKTLLDIIGTDQQVLGMDCFDFLHGECCNTANCPLVRIREGEERIEFEEEKTLPDGRTVSFLITATPFRDHDGNLLGIVEDFKDITKRKQAEVALKESEERFRDLFESSPNMIQNVTPDGNFLFVNPAWHSYLGYTPDELKDLTIRDIVHPDHLAACQDTFQGVLGGSKENNIETLFITKDGRELFVSGSASCKLEDGRPVYTRGIFRDITAQKRAEAQLEEILEEMEVIFDTSMVGILFMKGERLVSRINKRMAEIMGYSTNELLGRSVKNWHVSEENFIEFGQKHYARLAEDQVIHAEYPLKKRDGSVIWCLFSGKAIAPPDLSKGVIWIVDDISKRKIMEEKLKLLATTDKLTGAYNRRMFEEVMTKELHRARRHGEPLSLILFDIDHFKVVNDTYGHDAGDKVLQVITEITAANVRQMDYFARWGGEEFIILLPKTDLPQALEMADRLRVTIQSWGFDPAGEITVSLGVALLKENEDGPSLIKRADTALYMAKNNGRNRVETLG